MKELTKEELFGINGGGGIADDIVNGVVDALVDYIKRQLPSIPTGEPTL